MATGSGSASGSPLNANANADSNKRRNKKRVRAFTADERASHRVIEKQRREALNESFLVSTIPTTQPLPSRIQADQTGPRASDPCTRPSAPPLQIPHRPRKHTAPQSAARNVPRSRERDPIHPR
jgi:hypothetical protein